MASLQDVAPSSSLRAKAGLFSVVSPHTATAQWLRKEAGLALEGKSVEELTARVPAQYRGLHGFSLKDMIACGQGIREAARHATSMEEAAALLVAYFYRTLANGEGRPDCVLVRCFKTHAFQRLPEELKAKAGSLLGSECKPGEDFACLTLLATQGELPEWKHRAGSRGHAVIPLVSEEVVERAPMIAQLVLQMGLEIASVLTPSAEILLQADERVYGVFHVPDAVGSPSIPSQEFVRAHGVKSVLGFGCLLPSGELFAMILFSRVAILRETASLFRTLALSVKLVLLPFTRGPIFLNEPKVDRGATQAGNEAEQMRSEIATLKLLLPALEEAALFQTGRLELVVHDLRLRAEEVERLGSRLSAMLEATTDAVFLLDRDWRFTYLNRHAMTLLQADHGLLGKDIREEFPGSEELSFTKHYRTAMYERAAVQFEEHYPLPLNRWFEVHAFPSDSGIAVFFRDATVKRKTAEALINTEKLAIAGRLAASIAHELNNPLESVTNLLYLARGSAQLSEVQQYLQTADRELRRASAITSQTLRFHRQSSKQSALRAEELIAEVLSVYQGRLVNSQVQVETRFRNTLPVLCFVDEIRQVLNNLVANAIDAMPMEMGRMLVRSRDATQWSSGRTGMTLTLADNGSGMSPQARLKAFEPFFTTKGIGGTGLGLWISSEIVARHQGRIAVKSRQGSGKSGTTFRIFLPSAPGIARLGTGL